MALNYIKLIDKNLIDLPDRKKEEVYDFVKFLKINSSNEIENKKEGNDLWDIVDLYSDVSDLSVNHDKYLHD